MIEADRLDRNAKMLLQCYPAFQSRLAAVLWDLQGEGYRPRIQCAWRSMEDQMAAFQAGHSKLRFGFHNVTNAVTGVPEALAADVLDDNAPLAPGLAFIFALGGLSVAHGLMTGVLWGLDEEMAAGTSRAILERHEGIRPAKIGWDPCHVQVVGMSARAAKMGSRPV